MPNSLMLDAGVQTTDPVSHEIQTIQVNQSVSEDKLGSLPKFSRKRDSYSTQFAHILSRPSSSQSVGSELKSLPICQKCNRKKRSYWPVDHASSRPTSPRRYSFVIGREQFDILGSSHAESSRAWLLPTQDLRPEVSRQVELQLKRQSMPKPRRITADPDSTRPFANNSICAESKARPQTSTDKLRLEVSRQLDSALGRPVDLSLGRKTSVKPLRVKSSAVALSSETDRNETKKPVTAVAIAESTSGLDLIAITASDDKSIITALPLFAEAEDNCAQNVQDSVVVENATVRRAPETTLAAPPALKMKSNRLQKRRPVISDQQIQQQSVVGTTPPSTKYRPQRVHLNCMGSKPKSHDIAYEVRRVTMLAKASANESEIQRSTELTPDDNGWQTRRDSMIATARAVGAAFIARPASAISTVAPVRPSSTIKLPSTAHAWPPAASAAPVRTASIVPAAPPAAAAGPAEATSPVVPASPIITTSPIALTSPALTTSPVAKVFPASEASLTNAPSTESEERETCPSEASKVKNMPQPEHDTFAQSRSEDLPESAAGDLPTAKVENSPIVKTETSAESESAESPEIKPKLSPRSPFDISYLPSHEKYLSHSSQDSGYQSSSEPSKSTTRPTVQPTKSAQEAAEADPFSSEVFRNRLLELRLHVRQAREELLTSVTAPAVVGVLQQQQHSGLKAHLETRMQLFSAVSIQAHA